MVYTTTKDIETWQVQKEEYKQYTEEAIILCTEGKCFCSLQKEGFIFPWSEVAKLASMLMTEKHRESSKKAASYSTLISSANHAIIFIYLFICEQQTHSHSDPMGERNSMSLRSFYKIPQIFSPARPWCSQSPVL